MSALTCLLAWLPFVNPVKLPPGARLWMFLPLALCVALVYRATRARRATGLLKPTLLTFGHIVIGMTLIGVGVFALHEVVLRVWN